MEERGAKVGLVPEQEEPNEEQEALLLVGEDKEQGGVGGEGNDVLRLLDSVDRYLTISDSLSATLRQGWMDLASARHSMGAWRVNGALLDLKPHSASTSVFVCQNHLHANLKEEQQHFVLHKWDPVADQSCNPDKISSEDKLEDKLDDLQLQCRANNPLPDSLQEEEEEEKKSCPNAPPLKLDDQVQRERSKPLSMFGAFVSPKLQSTQQSFETALERLVEIANARSEMLSSYAEVCRQQDRNP